MSAASQTWTLDTTGMKYIDRDRIEHIITANEALYFTFTDDGVGGRFIGALGTNGSVLCTDGFRFKCSTDSRFEFTSSVDGSATINNGEICFVENHAVHPFKVTSLTIANADGVGADNVTTITLESIFNGLKMTWTLIDTA